MKKIFVALLVLMIAVMTSSCSDWRFLYNQQRQINYPSVQKGKPINSDYTLGLRHES